ncbi:hypothetical protein [Neorhodopirellula pilleata]|uniref:hypothetical protein n=1 Tax=Neorhodopirellula pilleata TaxID=2714738 RepID=UPI0011B66EB3|nr:hypothetical protein [Neorhodopirellula pilleata]
MSGRNPSVKVTWAEAFRDITIRSIDRGQLPILAGFFLIIIIAWRLPEATLEQLASSLVGRFVETNALGWVFAVLLGGGWVVHAATMRRVHHNEMKRLAQERTQLQKKLSSQKNIHSSKRNRK